MARKFFISEDQYNILMSEGIVPNTKGQTVIEVPTSNGGELDANKTKETVEKLENDIGKKIVDTNVVLKPEKSENNNIQESKIITKAQMIENRLKNLKKNSKTYTLKEFMSKLS